MADPVCICSVWTREQGWVTKTCPKHDPLSDGQKDALRRHGYNPDYPPRGNSGPPDSNYKGADGVWLRPHVCYLDGIKIDGHEASDLDPLGSCIQCGDDLFPDLE